MDYLISGLPMPLACLIANLVHRSFKGTNKIQYLKDKMSSSTNPGARSRLPAFLLQRLQEEKARISASTTPAVTTTTTRETTPRDPSSTQGRNLLKELLPQPQEGRTDQQSTDVVRPQEVEVPTGMSLRFCEKIALSQKYPCHQFLQQSQVLSSAGALITLTMKSETSIQPRPRLSQAHDDQEKLHGHTVRQSSDQIGDHLLKVVEYINKAHSAVSFHLIF